MLTELKSEKNFELAVKIFEISDELCFKENRKYHEIARQQARRTTAECLNEASHYFKSWKCMLSKRIIYNF